MLEILNIALNNNYIYIGIIAVLIIIIIITILSIKKDREKMAKRNKPKEIEPVIEPATSVEEQQKARLELERVVNTMKNDIEKKPNPAEIVTYEQEQEEKAIISYQELVAAVRKNTGEHQPQTEVGMEVAEKSVIEEPTSVEEKINAEETEKKVDSIFEMIDSVSTKDQEIDSVIDEIENNESIIEEDEYEPVHASNELDIKEERKFRTSEFISPIYGKQPQGEIKPIIKEEKEELPKPTPSLDEVINEDLSNSDEFLDALKNFRNNL